MDAYRHRGGSRVHLSFVVHDEPSPHGAGVLRLGGTSLAVVDAAAVAATAHIAQLEPWEVTRFSADEIVRPEELSLAPTVERLCARGGDACVLALGDAEATLLGPPLDGALQQLWSVLPAGCELVVSALRIDAAERGGGGSGERLHDLLQPVAARQGLLKLVPEPQGAGVAVHGLTERALSNPRQGAQLLRAVCAAPGRPARSSVILRLAIRPTLGVSPAGSSQGGSRRLLRLQIVLLAPPDALASSTAFGSLCLAAARPRTHDLPRKQRGRAMRPPSLRDSKLTSILRDVLCDETGFTELACVACVRAGRAHAAHALATLTMVRRLCGARLGGGDGGGSSVVDAAVAATAVAVAARVVAAAAASPPAPPLSAFAAPPPEPSPPPPSPPVSAPPTPTQHRAAWQELADASEEAARCAAEFSSAAAATEEFTRIEAAALAAEAAVAAEVEARLAAARVAKAEAEAEAEAAAEAAAAAAGSCGGGGVGGAGEGGGGGGGGGGAGGPSSRRRRRAAPA